jgi:hypothetical protein
MVDTRRVNSLRWLLGDKMSRKRRTRGSAGSPGRTAEDRARWAAERQQLVGTLITQEGTFEGAMVTEHIHGSQYLVELTDGTAVYASHKKNKDKNRNTNFSFQGWQVWEDR